MRNRELKGLVKIVANEESITAKDIEEIIDSPFIFQATVMRSADRSALKFPSVRIPYWGIFHAPQWRVDKLKDTDENI